MSKSNPLRGEFLHLNVVGVTLHCPSCYRQYDECHPTEACWCACKSASQGGPTRLITFKAIEAVHRLTITSAISGGHFLLPQQEKATLPEERWTWWQKLKKRLQPEPAKHDPHAEFFGYECDCGAVFGPLRVGECWDFIGKFGERKLAVCGACKAARKIIV